MVKSGHDFREMSLIKISDWKEEDVFEYDTFPLTIPCKSKGFSLKVTKLETTLKLLPDPDMKMQVLAFA
jgi:hypothetical protein